MALRFEERGALLWMAVFPGDGPPLDVLGDGITEAERRAPGRLALAWEGDGPFLAPLVPRPGERAALEEWLAAGRSLAERLAALPFPVVAVLPILAAGPPLELALACDARIAPRDGRIGFPDVQAGTLPGWGGLERAVELTGPTRALEWLLSGAALPAGTALSWGLVDEVVGAGRAAPDAAAAIRPRRRPWPLPDRLLRWLPFLRRMAFSRARLRAGRMAPEPAAYPAPHRVVRLVELCLAWPAGEVAAQVTEAVLEAAGSQAARELPRLAGNPGFPDPQRVLAPIVAGLGRALPVPVAERRRMLAGMVAWGFDPAALGRATGEEKLLEGLSRGRGAALLLSRFAHGVDPARTTWYPALLAGALRAWERTGGDPLAIDRLVVRELGWPAWRGGPLRMLARSAPGVARELLERAGDPSLARLVERLRRPGAAE